MNTIPVMKFLFYSALAVAVVLWGLLFPQMNFKAAAIVFLGFIFIGISLIPMRWALLCCLVYIGFEGFFKIISDYHPVVHIGSDLLVILLLLRVLIKMFFRGNPVPDLLPPLMGLFLVHFLWILITLFNPYSLGFIPSIAGSKIYITMPLLFFFAYYESESIEDLHFFIKGFIFVAFFHTLFGLYQSMNGPESVLSLHPRYAIQLEKYKNTAFRPFGLTNLPGGPAVYLAPVIPLTIYYAFVQKNLLRIALLAFCAAGISLVLLCQIRAMLFKVIFGVAIFIFSYFIVYLRSNSKSRISIYPMVLASLLMLLSIPKWVEYSTSDNEENQMAVERSLSLFDIDKVSNARRNAWPRFVQYFKDVPFGAGFARVGASGGAFAHLQQQDPFFKPNYFFADNFWIACLVEIGIPGVIFMTLLIIFIFLKGFSGLKKVHFDHDKLAMCAVLAALVPLVFGLYGAEGILYNPDASFFWFLSGILLKIPIMSQKKSIS